MEDRLIEAVRKRPCIYDKKSLMYRNKIAKEKAWKAVSQVVGANVKICMGRWRSLRDRYVRESARAKDSDSGRTTWRYLQPMSFIQNHVTPRRGISYLDKSAEDEAQEPNEFIFSEIVKDSNNETYQLSISKKSDQEESNHETYEEEILPILQRTARSQTSPHRAETPPKKRQKLLESANERFEKLCAAVTDLIESKKHSYKKSRNEDFFRVLDGYILKLPDEEQDNLKVQFLNMVQSKVNPLEL